MPIIDMTIPTAGDKSDIRIILAIATSFMRRKGVPQAEIINLRQRVLNSHTFEDSCKCIKEWFTLKPDPTRRKPKLNWRGKDG